MSYLSIIFLCYQNIFQLYLSIIFLHYHIAIEFDNLNLTLLWFPSCPLVFGNLDILSCPQGGVKLSGDLAQDGNGWLSTKSSTIKENCTFQNQMEPVSNHSCRCNSILNCFKDKVVKVGGCCSLGTVSKYWLFVIWNEILLFCIYRLVLMSVVLDEVIVKY